jgi:D-alanyl-lipoteichoic acid acyltransferase DltB (MBOAT superfamily)
LLFNSYIFIFAFLPIALSGFLLATRIGQVAAGVWLVVVSLFFYGWWDPRFVPLLLISIGANYGLSELMLAVPGRPQLQSALLAAAIGGNLLALVYYKYLFSILAFLSMHHVVAIPFDNVVLPLGISFFTFTQIGYLVDVKQGVAQDRGLLNYLMFVTFFPHLIAGPILQNREIMPQFADPATYRLSARNITIGLSIFIIGLFKKTVFADPLAVGVAQGFSHAGDVTFLSGWHTALTYSLQLYFDFSGYSDMAIGLARMFNVSFPLNFDSPFKSPSIIEFWQRWHMTLTRFLNLYLYNWIALAVVRSRTERGLGITRKAQATLDGFLSMIIVPTFITMALIGIWHGAGLQFVVFGLLHGVYLSINHAWRIFWPVASRRRSGALLSVLEHVASVLLTYTAVLVGMVFFRSSSVETAMQLLAGMCGRHGVGSSFSSGSRELLWITLLYAVVWGMPNTQQLLARYEPALGRVRPYPVRWLQWRGNLSWGLLLGAGFATALLAMGGTSEFIYFQF